MFFLTLCGRQDAPHRPRGATPLAVRDDWLTGATSRRRQRGRAPRGSHAATVPTAARRNGQHQRQLQQRRDQRVPVCRAGPLQGRQQQQVQMTTQIHTQDGTGWNAVPVTGAESR